MKVIDEEKVKGVLDTHQALTELQNVLKSSLLAGLHKTRPIVAEAEELCSDLQEFLLVMHTIVMS